MSWKSPCLGLLTFFFASLPVVAQQEYRLEPGDTIEVWAAQEAALRRAVVVAPDGMIALPLAGHLQASGQTLTELEGVLHDRLRPFFKDAIDLTVMLQPRGDRAATIFVVGDVATPGAYAFRSGMTILHSVSVAGGLYRTPMLPADQDRSVLVEREIAQGQTQIKELSARIARVQTELADGASIASGADADPFIAQEQKVLDARRAELALQTEARQKINELGQRNAQAVQEHSATLDQRIELTRRRLDSTAKLVSKGFANVTQQLELESDIAELEGMRNQLVADSATASSAAISEKARLDGELQQRRSQLVVDLREAQRERDAAQAQLRDNMRIAEIYDQASAQAVRPVQRSVRYSIVREVDGRPTELEADEMTSILPGDLVRVSEASAQQAAAVPSSSTAPAGGHDAEHLVLNATDASEQ
jgi:polysaccharide biosynthesis/export protein ExoF